MKSINPYLNFDGETRDAMTFYGKCLDAELAIHSFKDSGMESPPGSEDRTIHAVIRKGNVVIMASDTMPGMDFVKGNNVWINIECTDTAEQDKLFAALGEGGTVVMPLADQFWGARFGMLNDTFGLGWMFNCETKK